MTTEPTEATAVAAALLIPSKASSDVRAALDSLTIALEATRMAIEAADEAPGKAGYGNPTPSQILENWHAAAVPMHEVFDNLYYDARHAVGLIKPMLTLD